MLKLYHHGSSACSAKVRLVLEEKGLEWQSQYLDILKGEQFTAEFLAINPKAVVPVLIHDDEVIPESTVICEYLEDAFPDHPLYPRTPIERARARLWTKAVDEELHPACSAITYTVSHRHTILRNGVGNFEDFLQAGASEGVAARKMKWEWIQQGLKAPGAPEKIQLYDSYLHKMEKALESSDWLVGSEFSIADLSMTPYVNRLAALSMEGIWQDGRLPKVEDWFERIKSRPSFKKAMLDWMPSELTSEMLENGRRSWPEVHNILNQQSFSQTSSGCAIG